jgi:hypothetical protein
MSLSEMASLANRSGLAQNDAQWWEVSSQISVGARQENAGQENERVKNRSRINCVGCMSLPTFSFVPAQRAIRFDSLAHRARKPVQMISKGPTGRPFAVKDHHSESNCRPVGPSTSGCFRFQGRWPWLFELLALWAETKNKRQKHGVVSGRVLSDGGWGTFWRNADLH